jgi:DNA-directed RNA polymerase subunit M/transcription elongation factor TFIIS
MVAFCHSCHQVVHAERTRNVRCPNCNTWQSLERISEKQAEAMGVRWTKKPATPREAHT